MKPTTRLRVTGGESRGTLLDLPDGVRPLPSRMKQALFNVLADRVADAAVLDLFSGTGSLGIEAVSRGAARAVLVERDPRVMEALKDNALRAGVADRCTILCRDAYLAAEAVKPCSGPFDIVFLDPPYAQSEDAGCVRRLGDALEALDGAGMLSPDAALILHVRAAGFSAENLPERMEAEDVRRYGSGTLMICRLGKNTCNKPEAPGRIAGSSVEED